jgi:hypothetical protein
LVDSVIVPVVVKVDGLDPKTQRPVDVDRMGPLIGLMLRYRPLSAASMEIELAELAAAALAL